MKNARVFVAAIAGVVLVLAAVYVAGWLTGSDGDLCALSGVILTGREDALGWIAGAGAQIIVAVISGYVYAAIFEWVTRRAGLLIGLAIGIAHAIVAGLGVGFLPAARLIEAGIAPPGAFMEYRGAWVVATFVLAHIAFGALMGTWYGATVHTPPTTRYRSSDITARP